MSSEGVPRIFRILLGARDLDASRRFYEELLGAEGRRVAEGRYYFDCGPVILGVLDYSGSRASGPSTPAESLYFATEDLDALHQRARALGCLSTENLHDDPDSPLGEIRTRPWGERSFYVEDPSGNSLCFVDVKTMFTGAGEQVGD